MLSRRDGPGKTLAAYALAQALSLEVLRIDLAAVSSKYLGETSRSIDAMFDAAERAGEALLIDEADALFGTRSEVSDAHDATRTSTLTICCSGSSVSTDS